MSARNPAHVALHNRAIQQLLIGAWLGKAENVAFAKGSISVLRSLERGAGAKAAAKDASLGGYQPAACIQAAWARLPVDLERLTMAQVKDFLRTQGVEFPTDDVTQLQINGVQQLEDDKVSALDVNDEHPPAWAELNDGSGHGVSHVVGADVQRTSIVTTGGAA